MRLSQLDKLMVVTIAPDLCGLMPAGCAELGWLICMQESPFLVI